ncbi:phosphate ABC transporter substrate-binding/OmpA family protein [Tabrizicola sp.]|uniref:phosphate ABC transporter substrate-binding/OmpA family protein n=1 Tax=Tabrizicola sp. TaxID=2005166 RepID=UPI003F2E7F1A
MSKIQTRLHRAGFGISALAGAMLTVASANAETVTLRSIDGLFVLTGQVLDASNGNYVIQGPLGELRVSAERVTCEGTACPQVAAAEPAPTKAEPDAKPLDTAASKPLAATVETRLLAGFAATFDAPLSVEEVPGIGHRLSGADTGEVVVANGAQAATALTEGTADFAFHSGPLSEAGALRADVVAFDALAVLANPSNPVDKLTLEELRDVYAGRITSWVDLGGEDRPIRVIGFDQSLATRDALEAALFAGAEVARAPGQTMPQGADAADLVVADPSAIAFVPLSAKGDAPAVEVVDACGVATALDTTSLKTGAYPLLAPVALLSRADATDAQGQDFRAYALSTAADAAYAEAGLVDRSILRVPHSEEVSLPATTGTNRTARLAQELLDDTARHDRLTTMVRFGSGSTAIDADSVAHLARLVDYLAELPQGTSVLLAGFGDNVGTAQTNRAVSASRALNVAEALQRAGGERLAGIEIAAKGFGDLAPLACNDVESGRAANRRVEVWIESPVQG